MMAHFAVREPDLRHSGSAARPGRASTCYAPSLRELNFWREFAPFCDGRKRGAPRISGIQSEAGFGLAVGSLIGVSGA
jgi:hypothetical protein